MRRFLIFICAAVSVVLLLTASQLQAFSPQSSSESQLFIPFVAVGDPTTGKMHFVSNAGNCGSITPCYLTIQQAIDSAAPGDIIIIADGVYTDINTRGGYRQVAYIDKSITLRGMSSTADGVIIDPQGSGRGIAIEGDVIDVVLTNLTIRNGNADSLGGGIFGSSVGSNIWADFAGASTLRMTDIEVTGAQMSSAVAVFGFNAAATIEKSVVHSNAAGGVYVLRLDNFTLSHSIISHNNFSGLEVGSSGNVRVEHSLLNNNGHAGVTLAGTNIVAALDSNRLSGNGISGVSIRDGATLALTNNIMTANGKHGLYAWGGKSPFGDILTVRLTLLHNTIADNVESGIDANGYVELELRNNIVTQQPVEVKLAVSDGGVPSLDATHTLHDGTGTYVDNSMGGIVNTANNFVGSAAFAAGDNYRLTAGSAAIDVGAATAVNSDIDDQPRPFGPAADLGADEYVPPR